MIKFFTIGSVAAAVAAGLFLAAAGAQAETRDHRGQPKQYAPPKACGYYNPTGCSAPRHTGWYCIANPSKCRDHRN